MRIEALKRVLSIGRSDRPLWWYPTLALLAGLAFGRLLAPIEIDGGAVSSLIYEGDADAARSFVSLAATSIASITTLTLTITIVTLQLASTQYSPRLIEHYLRDRNTRAVISLFLFTFAFAVATLLGVRFPSDDGSTAGQVPGVAISVLVVLIVGSLAALVFFVYSVTQSIRVESILVRVRDRTVTALRSRTSSGNAGDDEIPDPPGDGTVIRSRRTGFYVDFDEHAMNAYGPSENATVWVTVAPGDFVTVGEPVAVVVGLQFDDGNEIADTVERWLRFDTERWIEEDYTYGVRSLTDVAIKALSPGVNDPTTAVMAIHRISEVLAEAAEHHPQRVLSASSGARVFVSIRPWTGTVEAVLRQLALYGRDDIDVVTAVIRMLWTLSWTKTDVDRSGQIRDATELFRILVNHGVQRCEPDQQVIDDAFDALTAGFEGAVFAPDRAGS